MKKISVIMTSYNKPAYIGKSIQGILNQTYTNFELFLMDDNSNESTQQAIKPFLADQRIRYFRSDIKDIADRAKKLRYSVLINQALSMAEGEYITYATDDNVYRPQRLEKMSAYLDEQQEISIVYSASITNHVKDNGIVTRSVYRPAGRMTWLAPCAIDHCSVMHRRSILTQLDEVWGSAYWDENPEYYLIGDARFFWKLNHFSAFYPLNEVLDDNYMTEHSLHSQHLAQEKSEFIQLLPPQRTCKELREYLRKRQAESKL